MTPADKREAVARLIYERAMDYTDFGVKPDWVAGGNSLKQGEARRCADAVIAALTPDPVGEMGELVGRLLAYGTRQTGGSSTSPEYTIFEPNPFHLQVADTIERLAADLALITERAEEMRVALSADVERLIDERDAAEARCLAMVALLDRFIAAEDDAPAFGMCDQQDNDGEYYQSADFASLIVDTRAALSHSGE